MISKPKNETLESLILLVNDLYQEGYQCGRVDDDWIKAWALACFRIARGEKYTDDMVIDIHREIASETS